MVIGIIRYAQNQRCNMLPFEKTPVEARNWNVTKSNRPSPHAGEKLHVSVFHVNEFFAVRPEYSRGARHVDVFKKISMFKITCQMSKLFWHEPLAMMIARL